MSTPPLWLRGPIPGIEIRLQGVAHGLLENLEDLKASIASLPPDKLWVKPFGAASVGFHLQHLAGATDRLFTYARGDALTDAQRDALEREKTAAISGGSRGLDELMSEIERVFLASIDQLHSTNPSTIDDARYVGGKRLPSTVSGLLEHAAQHASRHVGQIVTTLKVLTHHLA